MCVCVCVCVQVRGKGREGIVKSGQVGGGGRGKRSGTGLRGSSARLSSFGAPWIGIRVGEALKKKTLFFFSSRSKMGNSQLLAELESAELVLP